jgi:hypothetical protein
MSKMLYLKEMGNVVSLQLLEIDMESSEFVSPFPKGKHGFHSSSCESTRGSQLRSGVD